MEELFINKKYQIFMFAGESGLRILLFLFASFLVANPIFAGPLNETTQSISSRHETTFWTISTLVNDHQQTLRIKVPYSNYDSFSEGINHLTSILRQLKLNKIDRNKWCFHISLADQLINMGHRGLIVGEGQGTIYPLSSIFELLSQRVEISAQYDYPMQYSELWQKEHSIFNHDEFKDFFIATKVINTMVHSLLVKSFRSEASTELFSGRKGSFVLVNLASSLFSLKDISHLTEKNFIGLYRLWGEIFDFLEKHGIVSLPQLHLHQAYFVRNRIDEMKLPNGIDSIYNWEETKRDELIKKTLDEYWHQFSRENVAEEMIIQFLKKLSLKYPSDTLNMWKSAKYSTDFRPLIMVHPREFMKDLASYETLIPIEKKLELEDTFYPKGVTYFYDILQGHRSHSLPNLSEIPINKISGECVIVIFNSGIVGISPMYPNIHPEEKIRQDAKRVNEELLRIDPDTSIKFTTSHTTIINTARKIFGNVDLLAAGTYFNNELAPGHITWITDNSGTIMPGISSIHILFRALKTMKDLKVDAREFTKFFSFQSIEARETVQRLGGIKVNESSAGHFKRDLIGYALQRLTTQVPSTLQLLTILDEIYFLFFTKIMSDLTALISNTADWGMIFDKMYSFLIDTESVNEKDFLEFFTLFNSWDLPHDSKFLPLIALLAGFGVFRDNLKLFNVDKGEEVVRKLLRIGVSFKQTLEPLPTITSSSDKPLKHFGESGNELIRRLKILCAHTLNLGEE